MTVNRMSVGLVLGLCCVFSSAALAQLVFQDGFETPEIQPLFPRVAGEIQLPPGPAPDQLQWIIDELASGETTSATEVEARFDPAFDFVEIANFIGSLRSQFPDGVIEEVVVMTPMAASVLVGSPGGSDPLGFFRVNARYAGDNRVSFFQVTNFPAGANNQFVDDQELALEEAGDKFETLASDVGLLVARIEDNGVCTPILERNANDLLGTGSIFKEWVLGGTAAAIRDGLASRSDAVQLAQTDRAVVGADTVNSEADGTSFRLDDLAIMMMGLSDNTATDVLHRVVGRSVIDNYISVSGVADPSVLSPILSTTQQFHLYWSFSLQDAQEYVDGSEAQQLQFLQDRIIPLGNTFTFPFANDPILTSGTWRASALDICSNFSSLRDFAPGSEAAAVIDEALGSSTGLARLRNNWDRVWFKGGSLGSNSTGTHVLGFSWLVEDNGRPPFVVVGITNDPSGGIDTGPNQGRITSILARLLDLVREGL